MLSGKRRRKWTGLPAAICLKSATPLKSQPSARPERLNNEQLISGMLWGAVGVMVIAIAVGDSGW
jgi:hypothetical protein